MAMVFEKPQGGWGNMLSVEYSNYDSSATAMILYFYSVGAQLGVLGNEYDPVIQRGFKILKQNTWRNGVVDRTQGGCEDLNKYSSVYAPFPVGQGMALAAIAAERYREDAMVVKYDSKQ